MCELALSHHFTSHDLILEPILDQFDEYEYPGRSASKCHVEPKGIHESGSVASSETGSKPHGTRAQANSGGQASSNSNSIFDSHGSCACFKALKTTHGKEKAESHHLEGVGKRTPPKMFCTSNRLFATKDHV